MSAPKDNLKEIVGNAENAFGPTYMLINCAGFAKPARFEDLSESAVKVNDFFFYFKLAY